MMLIVQGMEAHTATPIPSVCRMIWNGEEAKYNRAERNAVLIFAGLWLEQRPLGFDRDAASSEESGVECFTHRRRDWSPPQRRLSLLLSAN